MKKNRNILLPMAIAVLLSLNTLAAQAAPNSSVLQDLSQRLNMMGKEINQLRGENEKLNHQLEQLKRSQKKGFMAIDERLEKRQVAASKASQTKAQRNKVKKKAVPVRRAATKTSKRPAANSEKVAYNHAYQTLKGNRDAGIREFTLFLKKYPTSKLAENAHYWIGEAQYAKKNYRAAIDSFIVVLNKYKSGRKAPDAAVKLGYSFFALKDWTLARRTFNDVLRYFPKSNAAKLAKSRLNRMKKEGH